MKRRCLEKKLTAQEKKETENGKEKGRNKIRNITNVLNSLLKDKDEH